MTVEYRQLADCNPRKGDVFENEYGRFCKAVSDTHAVMDHWPCSRTPKPFEWFAANYLVVSRHTPKTWGEMTDEEKGALLLAHLEGKVVEWMDPCDTNDDWDTKGLRFGCPDMAYRVRPPEPKRETVTIYGAPSKHIQWCLEQCGLDTHRITFDVIDGKPDCASIHMEEM